MRLKGTLLSAIILIVLMSNAEFAVVENPGNGIIDLSQLFDYVNLNLPERAEYRYNDTNPLTDIGATLGRVLFYDTKLSVNDKISCASCHQQENAFGDFRTVSEGFDGEFTKRHAMRLINTDLHADNFKFWDERVRSLEKLTTLPIQDTIEMGFSGINDFPGIDSLLTKMEDVEYYPKLFEEVFGDEEITEKRMGFALAQFIRSIVTFDTPFDEGFNVEGQEISDFPNYTEAENRGKRLFFNFPGVNPNMESLTGAGCGLCHKAPSLDIIHISQNNGVIGVAGDSTATDITIRRAPSIKNIVKPDGSSNGPFMHDGSLTTLKDVVNHYNNIPRDPRNTMLDGLLFPEPNGDVDLQLSDQNLEDLVAFLKTLSGPDVYTNEKWSNPFDMNGNLEVVNSTNCTVVTTETSRSICDGSSYEGYTQTGSYRDVFPLASGCDSIRLLDLTVLPVETITENITICEGEEYNGLTIGGTYIESLPATSGCDTIYTLVLEVLGSESSTCNNCSPTSESITASICEGELYDGYTQSGIYTDTLSSTSGCDSIRQLVLTVAPIPTINENVTLCEGEEYNGLTVAGDYTLVLAAELGCDTIYSIVLEVLATGSGDCIQSHASDVSASAIRVVPNPVQDVIKINSLPTGNYNIRIFDINSKKVLQRQQNVNDELKLNVETLTNGIYLLALYNTESKKYYTGKFVKM